MKGSELRVEGPRRTGAASGEGRAEVDGADVGGVGAAEEDGALDLLSLDFWVPGKVTEGSSRFQQFFLI